MTTTMRHEPVADRLGVRTHKLPADWRQRGGGGGQPPRRPSNRGTGCMGAVAAVLGALLAVAVILLVAQAVTGDG